MARKPDEIAYTKIYEGDNYIARVHHPKLTPEEYERRHKQIHDAAVKLLMSRKENKI